MNYYYQKKTTGNIKYDLIQISKIYDSLFNIADYLIKLYKPCKLLPVPKYKQRKSHTTGIYFSMYCKPYRGDSYGWYKTCCSSCKYLGEKGCTTKNLLCKLYLCPEMETKYPELSKILRILEDIARTEYYLNQYFISRTNAIVKHFSASRII